MNENRQSDSRHSARTGAVDTAKGGRRGRIQKYISTGVSIRFHGDIIAAVNNSLCFETVDEKFWEEIDRPLFTAPERMGNSKKCSLIRLGIYRTWLFFFFF